MPNPEEAYKPGFDKSTLVPILVGMDFMGKHGHKLLIDFGTGLAMYGDNPEIFSLGVNTKGHFTLDIVHHLTRGHSRKEGHPNVTVLPQDKRSEDITAIHVLEFHPLCFDMTAYDHQIEEHELQSSRDRLWQLYRASRNSSSCAAASTAFMCGVRNPADSPSTSSPSSLPHGNIDSDISWHCGGGTSATQGQIQGEGGSTRPVASILRGSTRPTCPTGCVAVLQPAHCRSPQEQCPRGVDSLLDLQPSIELHSSPGQRCSNDEDRVPSDGEPDAQGAQGPHGRPQAYSPDLLAHAEPDQRRGGAEQRHRGPQEQHTDGLICDDYLDDGSSNSGSAKQSRVQRQLGNDGRAHASLSDRSGCATVKSKKKEKRDDMLRPLPHHMGQKVMSFVTVMMAATSNLLAGLALDERDGLWEIACAPHSWLSEAAQSHDLRPRRINMNNGFDLYDAGAWHRLHDLRRRHRPQRLWVSLPCTKWCPWTQVNYNTPEKMEQLASYQRRERRMLWHVNEFIKTAIDEDPDINIYWEWPFPCHGWKQQPLRDLEQFLEERCSPFLSCRVDGCVYGLQDKSGAFLKKKWLIKTTDERFHKTYRAKVCCGNHGQHGHIQGIETEKTAFYPWRMCVSIAKHFRDQMVPSKHLKLLHNVISLDDDADAELMDQVLEESCENDVAEVHEAPEVTPDLEDEPLELASAATKLEMNALAREALATKRFSFEPSLEYPCGA